MYLISAYFDVKSEKILKKYIDRISAASGNTFMTDNNVPPHITISAVDARSAEVLFDSFIRIQESFIPGKITVPAIGQLLPYVLYAAPVMNRYISSLSSLVYEAIKDIPETSVSRLYIPGNWMPHITLAKKLTHDQHKAALSVMLEHFMPMEAEICRLGLAKVNPHEDVMIIERR
ncbi:MAG: hypothetical protein HUJ76_10120 [Parasporobacterium sp.]|nr:hypothetical protein [Parasporobacterium sp.]